MFISINGFSVLDDKALRKRWRSIRKSFTGLGRRIHATDSRFEKLRKKSIKLLCSQDANILSDFVSNIFYREYKNGQDHVFQKLGSRFKQIKNPL